MVILGTPNKICKPVGILRGPAGDIDIATLECSFAVGVIPMCRVGVPPEALNKIADAQTSDIYQVLVGDGTPQYPMFTGYFSGENGKITPTEICAGLDLIHIARDLDQMRISSPSLHPSSALDYNYTYHGDSTTGAGADAGFIFESQTFFKPGNGKVSEQIVKGLIDILNSLVADRAQGAAGDEGFKIEAFKDGIAGLNNILHLNSTVRAEIAEPLATEENNSINTWARSRAVGSFNGMRSTWDTLTAIFSEMCLNLVCDNQGRVYVMADVAGFEAPKGNFLGPDYVCTFDHSSQFFRNIKEVNLITDQMRSEQTTFGSTSGTLVTYPENSKDVGASMAIQMPGWLNPIAFTGTSKDAQKAQVKYAQALYYQERNKMRTMAVTGPFAPRVVPGTTATIAPYSAIKTFSGQGIDTIKKTYTGFCYQVNHFIDVRSKSMQTTFYFRNISDVAKNETIKEHAIFSDVTPNTWV